jgi:hypothetical protein
MFEGENCTRGFSASAAFLPRDSASDVPHVTHCPLLCTIRDVLRSYCVKSRAH